MNTMIDERKRIVETRIMELSKVDAATAIEESEWQFATVEDSEWC